MTNYERKAEEMEKQQEENRPTLLIFADQGGSVPTNDVISTRQEISLNYRIFSQLCQKGRK